MDRTPQAGSGTGGVYERRDMSVRATGIFLVALTATVVLVFGLMWWLFDFFATSAARRDVPRLPLAQARQVPPAPSLQVTPQQDLKAMRTEEDALLRRYGWVDQKAGTVRIPIQRAMKLLAERGLPRTSQKAGQ